MSMDLVLLANGTASDKVVNKHRESRPPEVTFNNSFGVKTSEVTREGRGMDGVEQGGSSRGWYIHLSLII